MMHWVKHSNNKTYIYVYVRTDRLNYKKYYKDYNHSNAVIIAQKLTKIPVMENCQWIWNFECDLSADEY